LFGVLGFRFEEGVDFDFGGDVSATPDQLFRLVVDAVVGVQGVDIEEVGLWFVGESDETGGGHA
jgi:hypothetical protein